MLKPPSKNNVELIRQELEKILKKESVKVTFDDSSASILFLPVSRLPVSISDLRSELLERGYLFFYSSVLYGKEKQELLSFNISKM